MLQKKTCDRQKLEPAKKLPTMRAVRTSPDNLFPSGQSISNNRKKAPDGKPDEPENNHNERKDHIDPLYKDSA